MFYLAPFMPCLFAEGGFYNCKFNVIGWLALVCNCEACLGESGGGLEGDRVRTV